MLPYFLGCPSWNDPAWRGQLYPTDSRSSTFLSHYAQVFNAVEGNTTFYAEPNAQTLERWAALMPGHFRLCAKLPRTISHAPSLLERQQEAQSFLARMSVLGARLSPCWLQLPAHFSAARLPELASFLKSFNYPLAVEVRHLNFFLKGEEERALNRLLRDHAIERICFDSRALFSCQEQSAAVLHAQARKPRLPIRATAFSASPQLRFIGHPRLQDNDPFLAPWVMQVARWIEQGLQPYVFMHTPDNKEAPQLAARFHQQLQHYLPGLPDLMWPQAAPERQPSLW
jgi:uncharacterized protein YecE (DUF72 family)